MLSFLFAWLILTKMLIIEKTLRPDITVFILVILIKCVFIYYTMYNFPYILKLFVIIINSYG